MNPLSERFQLDSERVSGDQNHRKIIRYNMSKYDQAVNRGQLRYSNLDKAKQRASEIKDEVMRSWDSLLIQFEENISKRGVKVLWAGNADEAISLCLDICKVHEAKSLVKSKSMLTEEIEFNHFAEKAGIEAVETDLGEFIVQVAGEKPYHIVTPAMHKSRKDVADLFHEKFGMKPNSSPEEITLFVRDILRKKYQLADVGVTGANFLVADPGAVALTENEGNGLMSTAFPKVHIVLAGIEKIIPRIEDLSVLWPVLAVHGTGQQVTVYNSLFFGPKKESETNGPAEMIVILLDNGRSYLYEKEDQYEALKCIRCGACLNGCPVYRNIGGYTYNTTYSGPIGSIISPHFRGMKEFGHLSYASSLCGKCTEVCPVKIDLHRLLLYNRREYVENGYSGNQERLAFYLFKWFAMRRKAFDFGGSSFRNFIAELVSNRNIFGKGRQLPNFKTSFSKQFKKRK